MCTYGYRKHRVSIANQDGSRDPWFLIRCGKETRKIKHNAYFESFDDLAQIFFWQSVLNGEQGIVRDHRLLEAGRQGIDARR